MFSVTDAVCFICSTRFKMSGDRFSGSGGGVTWKTGFSLWLSSEVDDSPRIGKNVTQICFFHKVTG